MGKVIWGHLLLTAGAAAVAYWPLVFNIAPEEEASFIGMAYFLIFPLIALICCFMCGLRGVFFGLSCAFFTVLYSVFIPYPYFAQRIEGTLLLPGVGAVLGVAMSCAVDRFIRHKAEEDPDYKHLNP